MVALLVWTPRGCLVVVDPLPCLLCPAALLCASAFSGPSLPLLEKEYELSYGESLHHGQSSRLREANFTPILVS